MDEFLLILYFYWPLIVFSLLVGWWFGGREINKEVDPFLPKPAGPLVSAIFLSWAGYTFVLKPLIVIVLTGDDTIWTLVFIMYATPLGILFLLMNAVFSVPACLIGFWLRRKMRSARVG